MPYSTNSDLPDSVTNVLPAEAQTRWREVFNDTMERHGSEGRAMATAWRVVGEGWKKVTGGRWVRKIEGVSGTEQVEWRQDIEIAKVDGEKGYVFGWANVAVRKDGQLVTDRQDDQVEIEELEEAAYKFVLEFRDTGEMHKGTAKGKLIESFVVTPEKLKKMGLESDSLPQGWWVGFHVTNKSALAKIRDGTYKAFSIQGRAQREEVKDGGD